MDIVIAIANAMRTYIKGKKFLSKFIRKTASRTAAAVILNEIIQKNIRNNMQIGRFSFTFITKKFMTSLVKLAERKRC